MAVVLITFISSHLFIKHLFIRLVNNSSKEIIALASISVAFIWLQVRALIFKCHTCRILRYFDMEVSKSYSNEYQFNRYVLIKIRNNMFS